jgi:hypothetical protein
VAADALREGRTLEDNANPLSNRFKLSLGAAINVSVEEFDRS